jgi:protein-export membrane protein SecD
MRVARILAIVLASVLVATTGLWAAYAMYAQYFSNWGSVQMVLAVDTAELRNTWLNTLGNDAEQKLQKEKVAVDSVAIVNGKLQLRIAKPEDRDIALNALQSLGPTGNMKVDIGEEGIFTIAPTQPGLDEQLNNTMASTISVLRQRMQNSGIAVRQITRQGDNNIFVHVVHIAAPQDIKQLRYLVTNTGRLSFHEVHHTLTASEARRTHIPIGFKIYPPKDKSEEELLLRKIPAISPDAIADAQTAFDPRSNEPIVTFQFTSTGARQFGQFTLDNIGRKFAIVFNGQLISAPVIREPILGGYGQISGNISIAEAQSMALALKSGALPVRLTVIEEKTITGH